MKKFLLLIISFSLYSLSFALNPASGGDSDYKESEDATHIPAMIMVAEGEMEETISELEEMGVTVLRHRGNIILAFIPKDSPAMGKRSRGIEKIEFSRPRYLQPTMKEARNFNDANLIAEGLNLPQPYTGKGVVIGICDIGIDTRHPNFLDTEGKECRIRKVVHYLEQTGERYEYNTPEEIYDWRTDTRKDWHATHVAGIAAGALKSSGYHSLAFDADIVFSGSQLSDVGLLAGVEDIIEYAKANGKPAVINLSMGSYVGPHDGTSLFNQYLDMCADDAIICLSSGNEGGGGWPRSMSFDFTEDSRVLEFRAHDMGGVNFSGETEIWSLDDTPVDISLYLHSNTGGYPRVDGICNLKFSENESLEWRISADPDDPDYDEAFAAHYYEGFISIRGGVDPLNDRFSIYILTDLKSEQFVPGQKWAIYWPGFHLEAVPGTHVDIHGYGENAFMLYNQSGFPVPDNNMNVSDLATGFRVISVGMTNNTDIEAATPGEGLLKGEICKYSGYGTLSDGRKLPLTCAPGAYVISSISHAFLEDNFDQYFPYLDDITEFEGQPVYWIGEMGTSMSCPFVVSAIATWLQAYPKLSSEEALEIIQKTNKKDVPFPENPRNGQGWFEAYKGLQEVTELAGTLSVDNVEFSNCVLRLEGEMLVVGNPAHELISIEIYNASGILTKRKTTGDSLANISLSHLPKGIYLINVKSVKGSLATLKLIR